MCEFEVLIIYLITFMIAIKFFQYVDIYNTTIAIMHCKIAFATLKLKICQKCDEKFTRDGYPVSLAFIKLIFY